jgi:hypothetical protein
MVLHSDYVIIIVQIEAKVNTDFLTISFTKLGTVTFIVGYDVHWE